MLFKVEVNQGDISNRWRNYADKKATNDANIIHQYIEKYNIKIFVYFKLKLIFICQN